MNNRQITEELNKAIEILNNLQSQINSKSYNKKSNSKKVKKEDVVIEDTTLLLVQDTLLKNDFPIDREFINDVGKVITKQNISSDEFIKCIERVKAANNKEPKNDIKKYIFSCIYKIDKA